MTVEELVTRLNEARKKHDEGVTASLTVKLSFHLTVDFDLNREITVKALKLAIVEKVVDNELQINMSELADCVSDIEINEIRDE